MNKVARSPRANPFRRSVSSLGMTNVSAAPENVWRGGRGRSAGKREQRRRTVQPIMPPCERFLHRRSARRLRLPAGEVDVLNRQRLQHRARPRRQRCRLARTRRARTTRASALPTTIRRTRCDAWSGAAGDRLSASSISNGRSIGSRARSNLTIRCFDRGCDSAPSIRVGFRALAQIQMRNRDGRGGWTICTGSPSRLWNVVRNTACRAHDSIECALQRARVERSANPVEVGSIVGGRVFLEFGQKPHSPLR